MSEWIIWALLVWQLILTFCVILLWLAGKAQDDINEYFLETLDNIYDDDR